MTAKQEHEPCRAVKLLWSAISLVLVIAGFYLSFQEGRIRQLEAKNDSLVSMKKDVEYLTDSLKEVRQDVKQLLRQTKDNVGMYETDFEKKISGQ